MARPTAVNDGISAEGLRKALRLSDDSQAELARRSNVPQQTLQRWCQLGRVAKAEGVLAIVRATDYGVTPHELRPDLFHDPRWLPPRPSPTAATAGDGTQPTS